MDTSPIFGKVMVTASGSGRSTVGRLHSTFLAVCFHLCLPLSVASTIVEPRPCITFNNVLTKIRHVCHLTLLMGRIAIPK